MQAIPIMHECEASSFLTQGNEVWLVGANDSKRWVSAQLLNDLTVQPNMFALPPDFAWMTSQGLDSTVLEDEDIGAPMIARGPDGSLRVVAIAVAIDPAEWVGTWQIVDWLLGVAEPEAILPCHAADGTWQPGPGCASLLGDRTQSIGDWARGPRACEATAQVVPAPTC